MIRQCRRGLSSQPTISGKALQQFLVLVVCLIYIIGLVFVRPLTAPRLHAPTITPAQVEDPAHSSQAQAAVVPSGGFVGNVVTRATALITASMQVCLHRAVDCGYACLTNHTNCRTFIKSQYMFFA
jgi:hypothetical protein